MNNLISVKEFDSGMTKTQRILGWCYLPVHIALLPLGLSVLAVYAPFEMDDMTINVLYYTTGFAFTLLVMGSWLRVQFDRLLDNIRRAVLCMAVAYGAYWALGLAVAALLLLTQGDVSNPNNDAILSMADTNAGPMQSIAVFLAPVVEETLFRGVLFGNLRSRGRTILAYTVSVLAFSFYHIWQYVLLYDDPSLLIYALQYIPVSAALAWLYEHSESIWCGIFFHMILNAVALLVLQL